MTTNLVLAITIGGLFAAGVYLMIIEDRVYLIVSVGPTGHEASADALSFRNSFRLISE